MPVIPPQQLPSQVFWTTEDVLNFARMLVRDTQGSIQGQDLADNAPATWPLLNLCYAKLLNWLEDSNVESVAYAESVVQIPPCYSPDPATKVSIGRNGFRYANGAESDQPTLPPDLLEPLVIKTRPTGSILPMRTLQQVNGGLAQNGSGGLAQWEFRGDRLYLTSTMAGADLQIRYIPALPPLVQAANGQPANYVPLARAGEALAYMVAAEFAEIRDAPNGPVLRMKANEQLQIIANKTAKRSNNADTRRQGYGFGRRRRAWL